ncbi:MAG: four-helix bundle copper-binding protein [Oligoflexales bacterium]
MHQELTKEMRECIKACLDASTACTDQVVHCLGEGGKHAEARHIQLLLDCADICETSANFMSRHSDRHSDVCGICSDVCWDTAESCRGIEDETMIQCAQICERCAELCEKMAGKVRMRKPPLTGEKLVGQVI